MKKPIVIFVLAFMAGFSGAYLAYMIKIKPELDSVRSGLPENKPVEFQQAAFRDQQDSPVSSVPTGTATTDFNMDFTLASTKSTPSVVYIKTSSEKVYARSWMEWFFDEPSTQTVISSGSGVIFTVDGYIVTNHHVIENADQVEVIINRRSLPAEIIGTDPSTDIAVLKVDAENLPAITLGSSKTINVGEWVIAVGNPFNLTSTVTAGIVSAKGRQINILKGSFPVESFIQTDAAINPGNSGGALVNMKGELVGINTAILSRTGSYAGYGFAVPVDIVSKVVNDIIKYGEVQKAFLGADVIDIDDNTAKQWNISDYRGVIVQKVQQDGAAFKGGIKEGDLILAINGETVESRAAYEEIIGHFSPGDKVNILFNRAGRKEETNLVLTNSEGTTTILKREVFSSKSLGADFEIVSKVERDLLNIPHGVKILKIRTGLIRNLDIEEGFIITYINRYPIKDAETLVEILSKIRGKVIIEGVSKQGSKGYYSYYF